MQVSRLGNPLFNEVIVPLGKKDRWNGTHPVGDWAFAQYVKHPELAKLLPVLYPGVFPNLAGLKAERADLVAILLTGLPSGIIPGFQNYTGKTLADMLRLNVAIPPASKPNALGLLGGDLAGFPNGRRVVRRRRHDRAAGDRRRHLSAGQPQTFTPDAAASAVSENLKPGRRPLPGDASRTWAPRTTASTRRSACERRTRRLGLQPPGAPSDMEEP